MLVLSRKIGETIIIGDEVTLTVLNCQKNNVRIGLNAPKEVAIHREEIYERIARQKGLNTQAKENSNAKEPS